MYSRYCDKRKMLLRWMAKFGYSTLDLLIGVTNVKNAKTVYALKKAGLLDCFQTDVLNQKVWYLTEEGRKFAAEWEPAALGRGPSQKRFSSYNTLRHDMSLQNYILTTGVAIDGIVSERCMPDSFEHRPDALLHLDGSVIAIEMERTHKSSSRVYRIFMDHARAVFQHRHYNSVRYVFPDNAIAQRYLAWYSNPEWPMFQYDSARRAYVPKDESWKPPRGNNGIDGAFEFLVMDDLL